MSRRTRIMIGFVTVAGMALSACNSDDGGFADTGGAGSTTLAPLSTGSVTPATSQTSPTAVPGLASTVAPAPSGSTVAPPTGSGTGAIPAVDVRPVTFGELDQLLPDLTADEPAGSHVIELQNRTLSVTFDGAILCLGGGDLGLQPDSCAAVDAGLGVLTYSDDADTRVYAVLVSTDVAVIFVSGNGDEMPCYTEPVTDIGPMAVWWCENEFAPIIRFELASGPRLEVTIG